MTMQHGFVRRWRCWWGWLLCCAMLPACDAQPADGKPVVRLWLDAPVREVARLSSYRFPPGFEQGVPGNELITTPHVVVIDDPGLSLRFEDAGTLPSLASSIGYSVRLENDEPPSCIKYFGLSPLPNYVPLEAALAKAREIQDALLSQNFEVVAQPWRNRFDAQWEAAPAHLDAFEDLLPAFLNSAFYVKDATVFRTAKGRIDVELSLVNARRKWGSRTNRADHPIALPMDSQRSQYEQQHMTREDLLREPVYTLRLTIGPSLQWQKKQRAIPRSELMQMDPRSVPGR